MILISIGILTIWFVPFSIPDNYNTEDKLYSKERRGVIVISMQAILFLSLFPFSISIPVIYKKNNYTRKRRFPIDLNHVHLRGWYVNIKTKQRYYFDDSGYCPVLVSMEDEQMFERFCKHLKREDENAITADLCSHHPTLKKKWLVEVEALEYIKQKNFDEAHCILYNAVNRYDDTRLWDLFVLTTLKSGKESHLKELRNLVNLSRSNNSLVLASRFKNYKDDNWIKKKFGKFPAFWDCNII